MGEWIYRSTDRPQCMAKLLPRHMKGNVEELREPIVRTNLHNGNHSMKQAFLRRYRNICSA